MTGVPTSCSPNDSLGRATEFMRAFGVAALPVTDRAGCVVGIVTNHDISAARVVPLMERTVASVMTSVAQSCSPLDSMSTALMLMQEQHVHRLLVAEEGRLVGLLVDDDPGP